VVDCGGTRVSVEAFDELPQSGTDHVAMEDGAVLACREASSVWNRTTQIESYTESYLFTFTYQATNTSYMDVPSSDSDGNVIKTVSNSGCWILVRSRRPLQWNRYIRQRRQFHAHLGPSHPPVRTSSMCIRWSPLTKWAKVTRHTMNRQSEKPRNPMIPRIMHH
jgi:hypothetical protein